jgi:uncharacterized protein YfaT (DUF1175 family)
MKNYSYSGSLMKKKESPKLEEINIHAQALQEDLSVYPEILSTKDCAKIVGVTARTILNYVNLNWLKANGISSRSIRVLKTDLIKFILSRRFEDVFDRDIPDFKIIKKEKMQIPQKEQTLF